MNEEHELRERAETLKIQLRLQQITRTEYFKQWKALMKDEAEFLRKEARKPCQNNQM